MTKRIPVILLILLLALAAGHISYFATRLPATVVSHFDASGTPNGSMSRQAFLLFYGVLVLVLSIPFLLLGLLIKVVPDRLVNLPNKQYWLEPSRRAETHAYLQQWGYWFCDALLAFLISTMHLAIRANLRPNQRLTPIIWFFMIGFLCIAIGMTLALFLRFRRLPSPQRCSRGHSFIS
jgi:hypothetical protein